MAVQIIFFQLVRLPYHLLQGGCSGPATCLALAVLFVAAACAPKLILPALYAQTGAGYTCAS